MVLTSVRTSIAITSSTRRHILRWERDYRSVGRGINDPHQSATGQSAQAEVTRRREIVIGAVVFGAVLALLIGTHIYQTLELSGLQTELASLRADLQALNVKIKEVGDLQNKIKDLREARTRSLRI